MAQGTIVFAAAILSGPEGSGATVLTASERDSQAGKNLDFPQRT